MKIIIVIFYLFIFNLEANFDLSYKNVTVGEIENIQTIYDGYIIGKTNVFGKTILNKDYLILCENGMKFNYENNTKFKKDNYGIIGFLKLFFNKVNKTKKIILNENNYINITCFKNRDYCLFEKIKNKNILNHGHFVFKNNKLIEICESKSQICINKN